MYNSKTDKKMRRKKLFLIFAIVALISSCGQKVKKEVDSIKEEDTTTFNLADFLDIEGDTILKTEEDSIVNGKTLNFFWFSPDQQNREIDMAISAGDNHYPRVFNYRYVSNLEYTEITHNTEPPCPDSKLVFVGDSTTETSMKSVMLDEIILERMSHQIPIN